MLHVLGFATSIANSSESVVSKGIVSRPVAFSNAHEIDISFKFDPFL